MVKDVSKLLAPLRRIRACLNERIDKGAAARLDDLIRSGESKDPIENLSFQSGIKDRYLWHGPCTLLDNVSVKGETYSTLTDALIELAQACKELNLETEQSKQALQTHREWKKRGLE